MPVGGEHPLDYLRRGHRLDRKEPQVARSITQPRDAIAHPRAVFARYRADTHRRIVGEARVDDAFGVQVHGRSAKGGATLGAGP
jgi:hypothetical protein